MEKLTQWTEVVQSSFIAFGEKMVDVLPNILGAILLLVIGWIVARGVSFVVRKLLKTLRFDDLGEKLIESSAINAKFLSIKPSTLIGKFVYWIILLLFFISASDTLGWSAVSESIGNLINYLPQLFSALVIFVLGLYIASFARNVLKTTFNSFGLVGGNILSEIVFYIILIIIGTTATDQAGIDTTIITANITIIFGGFLLAFAISFGYSSREILTNILSSHYVKNNFEEGQKVEVDGVTGTIKSIDSLQVTIQTSTGDVLLPTKTLINERVNRS
ncbi:MAG: hypothetical protein RLN90_00870 [Balneolaceae bacterium]